MTDWAEAGKVGATGFVTVVVVLSILALALWILGFVTKKLTERSKQEEKGE